MVIRRKRETEESLLVLDTLHVIVNFIISHPK